MKIAPFATEHFYAHYEFSTPYQLCNSDCETVTVEELLELAGMSLAQLGQLALGYTQPQGNPDLREMIAEAYATASADDVIMLGAPIEGIYLIARAVLEPNDGVVVLTPAYDALINMFEHVAGAANVKKWAFTPAATGWQLRTTDGQLDLHVLDLQGVTPSRTIVGPPDGSNTYGSANGSIAGNKPHNPFLAENATFEIDVPGVTSRSGITHVTFDVTFGFGGDPGDTITVAEPTTMGLIALGGLGVLLRRRSRRRLA